MDLLFEDVAAAEKVLIGLNWLGMIWLQIWSKNDKLKYPKAKITEKVP